jgi:hypothetical protein
MKRTTFSLLSAIFLWLGSCCIATGQAPVAQSDQITQGQQLIQNSSSDTGRFEPVSVNPNTSSGVALQFPLSLASKGVVVQPLDGGVLQIGNSTIDPNGMLSFSFQVTDQPGVHRVIVIYPNATQDSPRIIALVQFEVPNPN